MNFSLRGCTGAAWKLMANQVMIMLTHPGGEYIGFDFWQGYPGERQELLEHIRRRRIKDVVFLTGDIHTFVAGDVRVDNDDTAAVATEFVGGSITSPGLGEGGGGVLPGAKPAEPADPGVDRRPPAQRDPWAVDADFDHHGYGLVTATDKSFQVHAERVDTVKRRSSRAAAPTTASATA